MTTIVRSVHRCSGCAEEDAAIGHPSAFCSDCDRKYRKGWNRCQTCDLLNLEPMHPHKDCWACIERKEAAEEARLYFGLEAVQ